MNRSLYLLPAAILFVTSASGCALQSTRPQGEQRDFAFAEIVEAAKRQLKERYDEDHPGVSERVFSWPPRVTRFDEYWEVTWTVTMPRATGGGPIVRLERSDLEFISVLFQQ